MLGGGLEGIALMPLDSVMKYVGELKQATTNSQLAAANTTEFTPQTATITAVPAETSVSMSGTYRLEESAQLRTGLLEVTDKPGGRLTFTLNVAIVVNGALTRTTTAHPLDDVHTGELEGEVEIHNGEAVFSYDHRDKPYGLDICKITMKFAADRIELEQGLTPCGFGMGVVASGTYIKTNDAPKPTPAGSQSKKSAIDTVRGTDRSALESCISGGQRPELVCLSEELDRQDARLNNEYRRVMSHYKQLGQNGTHAVLRKVELEWINRVKSECDTTPPDFIGNPDRRRIECRLDMTMAKADELAEMPQ
jgi:uncharacterized protein YecT (DUF1311 family)